MGVSDCFSDCLSAVDPHFFYLMEICLAVMLLTSVLLHPASLLAELSDSGFPVGHLLVRFQMIKNNLFAFLVHAPGSVEERSLSSAMVDCPGSVRSDLFLCPRNYLLWPTTASFLSGTRCAPQSPSEAGWTLT